ncbi:hypothetical protein SAMN05216344_102157 [Polaromonas sp. OV174]|uniref:hypothetical protein n=1 Tax=Polaromonas sp. OV174 TaxID=1855300 RepID=UPI0008E144E9|nr:hypothetical protein [Polaromonas sp. OV174]SFB73980.1 hypothetical protein SAMN05216344_102157 [Polaromonas sp. OV174]
MKAAFYKGRKRPFNRLTAWWLRGPYSHCELILGTDAAGLSICASSSMMDGGVRIKHMKLDPENWDVIEVGGDADALCNSAWAWISEHDGQGYDYLGLLGFVARVLGHDKQRWVCSEAVAAMLGMQDSWRFDPCSLYAALSRACGQQHQAI